MRRRLASKKKSRSVSFLWKVICLAVLLGLALVFVLLRKAYWDGSSNFTFVTSGESGTVTLYTFHSQSGSVIKVNVPGDIEVDVARDYGKLKIKNLWLFSQNEKIGGLLLQETVIAAFGFPVESWVEESGAALLTGNSLDRLQAIFLPFESDLNIGDKIRIFLYGLKLSNEGYVEINLDDYPSFVKSVRLVGGEEGFVVVEDNIPARMLGVFSDPLITGKNLNVVVYSAPDSWLKAKKLGKIVEILGPEIALLETKEGISLDDGCLVKSTDGYTRRKFARIFGCEESNNLPGGNFGIEVIVGNKLFL
ncbi:MAG: hypothetical protein ACD_52C00019G0001 [uncultured bacterium]|uniref:Uncharacterized protein n=1 Tax=Candidatus Woesebacteria bacterium RIFCSPHIGHO2_12_FULL_41_24 TaxID=1802510 RepID=A0A1F8ARN8_9BACT|nr:MAG: hypothetical protein ACD_52C00019G0001 [uncultured bacterium]OGM13395.1 MAG: hypothetical protein A2W15_05865 [Candidatus Woesebacteria bacterium RBG_16_41_13]OGM30503.1 MAG: hypothetical protein A2873_02660 [Candidatus Woesebacteria bacterium RIFCSPHIGHO2_01_FULL_42_80]OGM35939.1 MAG: hypothetical protein A3D84_01655 [Candidatus Woesebacteria bacterium RIFCSPHIGHO2_02_FULL_42_20]OGM54169.1 MAG: hypothetical protein A3E44_00605 [Candidatus Woesebacteria bacterium RIFCSPHIGHO2_12_FULL_41